MEHKYSYKELHQETVQDEILDAWIAYHDTNDEQYFWACSIVMDIVADAPCRTSIEPLWEIILKFLDRDVSDRCFYSFAAGPLEDLLRLHGPEFIDRVEIEARRNPAFRRLMKGVWMGEENKEVTKRVRFWQNC